MQLAQQALSEPAATGRGVPWFKISVGRVSEMM